MVKMLSVVGLGEYDFPEFFDSQCWCTAIFDLRIPFPALFKLLPGIQSFSQATGPNVGRGLPVIDPVELRGSDLVQIRHGLEDMRCNTRPATLEEG